MAKILSSLFIPIYLSWVVNQTLENLYWFLTLIAKRAVFEVFFTYLCLKVSSAVDSIHPEECSMTTTYVHYRVILCQKKKKKKKKGNSQRDTLHCTQMIEKKLYAIEYKQYSFFRGSNWNWKPSTILLSWLPFARCLMHLVWTWRFINSG